MTSSSLLHTSEKLTTVPGINCLPSNYKTSRKLSAVPRLKLDSVGICASVRFCPAITVFWHFGIFEASIMKKCSFNITK